MRDIIASTGTSDCFAFLGNAAACSAVVRNGGRLRLGLEGRDMDRANLEIDESQRRGSERKKLVESVELDERGKYRAICTARISSTVSHKFWKLEFPRELFKRSPLLDQEITARITARNLSSARSPAALVARLADGRRKKGQARIGIQT
jgi:hypothetical protein